ncbi:stealth conserved region 3 domain-containing protein [Streptomyces bambusae]|uniref:stealth conserved region 3 domain-containing protein n=1 Tax=Streptomyces bambusae TaxID=1550616 RepID=UPI001CFCD99B|nr:stealth conserved region 3 domain-containing protein [Streptomyces bambusae]MCB5164649.1 stealth conserved region 3 domain-containing protein [Streptomyces bambusae]
MKITYLLTWADEMGGTEMAAYTQANHLGARHDVEVLSVFKTRPEPFFTEGRKVKRRYLIDQTGPVARPTRSSPLDDVACRTLGSLPSEIVNPSWESAFNRLSDIEMTAALGSLDSDVLVTTTPALMAAAVELAPARVVTVHQEHRASQLRGTSGDPLLVNAPRIDALVSLTGRTRDWFAESLRDSAPELAVIPNALPDGYRPRSDLEGKRIVLAARLTPEKQVDHAIHAFHLVCADFPDWTLRIFGDGPQQVRLRQLVEGLELQSRVELMGSTDRMDEEWAKAALCLLPSRNEAFGLVLVEAFAAGVPAIAYDVVTGPAEIIRHGVDGLLVPAGDVESLAQATARLMGDDDRRRAFGRAARAGVAERFSGEKITAQWEGLFERLLAGRDTAARLAARADRTALRIANGGTGNFSLAAPVGLLPDSAADQKARELVIQARSRTLIRSAGRLAEERDDIDAPTMARLNLEVTAHALTTAGIPFVLVRADGTSHSLAVPVEHRSRALGSLAALLHGKPVYGELVTPRGAAPGAVLAERLDTVGDIAGVRIFRPVTSSSRTLRYGPAYGCTMEFWEEDEDGWRSSPGSTTLVGRRLPSLEATDTLRIGDRAYPTTAAFTQRLVDDVDFPIDVVYTWVDDTDPAWRQRRDGVRRRLGMPVDGADSGDVRFRNRDELRYSLRSLQMFAPWVRTVHIVTDDQVPDWLDIRQPGLEVVSHRDLFPEPSWLPTFNSHAIESQLYRIEGLAEHFLYFNDDVFLGRPLTPGAFFLSNGTAKMFRSPTAVPPGPPTPEDEGYFTAAKNNRALLEEAFGRVATHGFLHAPHPLRRRVLAEIADRFSDRVATTARAPFRSATDLSIPSSLHHHYGYLTGTSVPATLSCGYVDAGNREHHAVLGRLLAQRNRDVFCIGESADAEVPADEQDRVVRAFLSAYFPVPSRFERI